MHNTTTALTALYCSQRWEHVHSRSQWGCRERILKSTTGGLRCLITPLVDLSSNGGALASWRTLCLMYGTRARCVDASSCREPWQAPAHRFKLPSQRHHAHHTPLHGHACTRMRSTAVEAGGPHEAIYIADRTVVLAAQDMHVLSAHRALHMRTQWRALSARTRPAAAPSVHNDGEKRGGRYSIRNTCFLRRTACTKSSSSSC